MNGTMNVNNGSVYKIMHEIFYIVFFWYFNIAKILRKAVWNGHYFCRFVWWHLCFRNYTTPIMDKNCWFWWLGAMWPWHICSKLSVIWKYEKCLVPLAFHQSCIIDYSSSHCTSSVVDLICSVLVWQCECRRKNWHKCICCFIMVGTFIDVFSFFILS